MTNERLEDLVIISAEKRDSVIRDLQLVLEDFHFKLQPVRSTMLCALCTLHGKSDIINVRKALLLFVHDFVLIEVFLYF